jgi:hypothetical protein
MSGIMMPLLRYWEMADFTAALDVYNVGEVKTLKHILSLTVYPPLMKETPLHEGYKDYFFSSVLAGSAAGVVVVAAALGGASTDTVSNHVRIALSPSCATMPSNLGM